MELLNIIINPNSSNICCICFKNSANLSDVNDDIEIHDEYFAIKINLRSVIKNLFPSHGHLLTKACEDCSTLILKIFSLFQRKCIKNDMLHYILDCINEEVDYKMLDEIKTKKCNLIVNIPGFERLVKYKTMKGYECQKCPMKFLSQDIYTKHIEMAHTNKNNAIICDICGKIFSSSSKLKIHLGCHKEKECQYCFKIFKSHSYFNCHIKRHKSHKLVKRSVKYLKCNNCDYKSINKCSLEAHINRTHFHFKPYICNICQKAFYKKDHLSQHVLIHKKEKEKVCHICGEKFLREKTLKEHLLLHSGQKPYICEICKIGFVTSGRRYEHMKRKHMDKTECCIICDKMFSLKKDVNIHIKNVHGVKS